ncbi:hypothetical protein [Microbacterium sp. MPKO10]|uniref:hypothetical protein n=1 Tax=Microbacterium sp. MPKO10 TaxID=2989818 RepID=UPI0022365648|nr:hypothetical protein [Microbacterium sp. MPKO10]MCW4458180.1 hypothetical protein [Microbacterium sp. MPKO10]
MADDTPHGESNEKPAEGQAQVPEQKETDWKAEARKWETRAKENLSAAKANEDAAKRLAEIEESQKTEAERAAERLAAAEKRAAELEAKATRAEVAAAKGVPTDLLKGSTKEELEKYADELIKFKGDSGSRLHVPNEGKTPKNGRPGNSSWSEVLQSMDAQRG